MIAAANTTATTPLRLASSPTSNVETSSASSRENPLEVYQRAGIPVTVSSDNDLMLTGPAGAGKTAAVRELLERMGETPVVEVKLDENTRLEDLGLPDAMEHGYIVILGGPLPDLEQLLKANESLNTPPIEAHPNFKVLFAVNPA
ncbi:MAG: AAA family ATPase [Armatimonadetes bacterium]|nr:AAA family ATPase [Armatimonadota bacterium]